MDDGYRNLNRSAVNFNVFEIGNSEVFILRGVFDIDIAVLQDEFSYVLDEPVCATGGVLSNFDRVIQEAYRAGDVDCAGSGGSGVADNQAGTFVDIDPVSIRCRDVDGVSSQIDDHSIDCRIGASDVDLLVHGSARCDDNDTVVGDLSLCTGPIDRFFAIN